MKLAKEIHELTKRFPKEEMYGLTSQLRRATTSIPSNIAEGSQRGSKKDFANFILIAKGSLAETRTQLLLAKDFGYCESTEVNNILIQMEDVNKMLYALHRTLTAAH